MTTPEDNPNHPIGAFTLTGFCRAFSVGRTFTYGEIAAGRLTARKARNRTVILKSEAERWAQSLPPIRASAAV
jgi:hypothetical protein